MENPRFKFRIWWKKENRYRVDTHIIPIGHLTDFANSDQYVVEQCTGLSDKNGNLIYEGDVVRFEIVDDDSVLGKTFERICEICFGKGDYSYSFVCKNDAYYRGYALLSSILCQEIESIEIIGNIHEQAKQKD